MYLIFLYIVSIFIARHLNYLAFRRRSIWYPEPYVWFIPCANIILMGILWIISIGLKKRINNLKFIKRFSGKEWKTKEKIK